MDINNFSYDEMEATFRRKRRSAIPKLWSYVKKLPDPYRPKFYTRLELFIPQPNFFSPFPCVLVSIRTTKYKCFFRVLDLDELKKVFAIPEDVEEKGRQALEKARQDANTIEARVKDILATKNLAGLPPAFREHLRVDEKTGEILVD